MPRQTESRAFAHLAASAQAREPIAAWARAEMRTQARAELRAIANHKARQPARRSLAVSMLALVAIACIVATLPAMAGALPRAVALWGSLGFALSGLLALALA